MQYSNNIGEKGMEVNKARREFLKITGSALSTAAVSTLGTHAVGIQDWEKPSNISSAHEKLNILFLGGTGFIGPHQVEYALARGHNVTLFNRGKTNPGLFPDVEKLRGDRNNDLKALENRGWDAIIDNSAHIPRWITDVSQILKDKVQQYLFISSTGVFDPYLTENITEDAKLATLEDPTVEEVNGETFGGLKVLCEKETEKWFPGKTTVIRPHLIVGPGDSTDRFTYWPVRIARGGEVMAPGDPNDPVQLIDVRDLAKFCIHCLEQNHVGAFNAAGPKSTLTIAGLLHGIRATVSNDIQFTWVDKEFLEEYKVQPWMHMTVWIPPEGNYLGMCKISNQKATKHGLSFRPLAETAAENLTWWEKLPEERRAKPKAGCPEDLERKVLQAWKKKKA